jgi:hypothetical protein
MRHAQSFEDEMISDDCRHLKMLCHRLLHLLFKGFDPIPVPIVSHK